MKIVMIVIDGLGDEPIPDLQGKTPLEAAAVPSILQIAAKGRIGCIDTCFPDFPIESSICIMGLLGYDPRIYYPHGRASFEAMAKGISIDKTDLALRCNLITVDEEKHIIKDFTGGMISDKDGEKIIFRLILPSDNWEIYSGQGYRNILIIRGADIDVSKVNFFEPHMNIGRRVDEIMPQSCDPGSKKLIDEIIGFTWNSQEQISRMNLPGSCKVNMLWLWSPSVRPSLPSFFEKTGLRAAVVGGMDFLHGLAKAAGIHFEIIPGVTGYTDTDYEAKMKYITSYLKDFDFILGHINAPDEEAHRNDFRGKIKAIEAIDRQIISPVLPNLEQNFKDDFRILICGDHSTRCGDGKHGDQPVPYVIYGKDISPDDNEGFSEKLCLKTPPIQSLSLLSKII